MWAYRCSRRPASGSSTHLSPGRWGLARQRSCRRQPCTGKRPVTKFSQRKRLLTIGVVEVQEAASELSTASSTTPKSIQTAATTFLASRMSAATQYGEQAASDVGSSSLALGGEYAWEA